MTANKPMTGEQLDELMTVAVNMQRDSEKAGDRPTAMFAYAVQVAVLELRKVRTDCTTLAAENAGLKQFPDQIVGFIGKLGSSEIGSDTKEKIKAAAKKIKTPATDAFLAEVRAQARNEGINYAAGRLAAAFNHGFVDKHLTEVCDVVRMILDTKEELANSTLPAADGLSGEYAEEFIEKSTVELRKGVQS